MAPASVLRSGQRDTTGLPTACAFAVGAEGSNPRPSPCQGVTNLQVRGSQPRKSESRGRLSVVEFRFVVVLMLYGNVVEPEGRNHLDIRRAGPESTLRSGSRAFEAQDIFLSTQRSKGSSASLSREGRTGHDGWREGWGECRTRLGTDLRHGGGVSFPMTSPGDLSAGTAKEIPRAASTQPTERARRGDQHRLTATRH